MESLLSFDYSLTGFFANFIPHYPIFDYLFSFFSLKGNSILIWILVMIISLVLEERKNPGINKKDKKFAILFLLAFLTTALVIEIPLKNLFHRTRPISSDFKQFQPTDINYNCPKDFSFPSGHAATAFAAATVLTYFDKKRKWFYYITAILISYSRLYLGCHFLFDVFIGALFGYFIAKLFLNFKLSHDNTPS